MTVGVGSRAIPGVGTYFVSIDVEPGLYRCEDGKNGWWVRFSGPSGERQEGLWPLPAGPAEVVIGDSDFAFESHVPTPWRLVTPLASLARARAGDVRPVAEPGLRAELDAIASRPGRLGRFLPAAALFIALLSVPALGGWALVALIPLVLVALSARQMAADLRRARALRQRRDRYLEPEDLDHSGRLMLARAQDAISTVMESEVNRSGMLDSLDNAVTLPRQEWEIAQALVRQSRLRAEQCEALAPALPEVEAALRPLRDKLDLSVQAVTRRVEELERYADRARAADEVLRAQRQVDALAERAHAYDELLAETARDDLALPAIERLTEQSETLLRMLRDRLVEAAEAASGPAAAVPEETGTVDAAGSTAPAGSTAAAGSARLDTGPASTTAP